MSGLVSNLRSAYRRTLPLPLRSAVRRVRDVEHDLVRGALFWLDANERRRHLAALDQCQSVQDHYEFAIARLGPHQRKTEIVGFVERAKEISPRYVCEIGTAAGGTNMMLGLALPSVEKIMGVDLYVQNRAQLNYYSRPSQTRYYRNASSRTTASVDWVKNILGAGNQLDVLFIDGDHSYAGVKADFVMYRKLVRDGGLIAFHDIVPDHQARYGKKTLAWSGEVPQFWEELKAYYPYQQFVQDPEQDGCGIGVLEYSSSVALPPHLAT